MTIREHQERLLAQIDAQPYFEGTGPLPEPMRQAYLATPRHQFVHRFRSGGATGALRELTPESLSERLPLIYGNAIQIHVDAEGKALPSSNSEPAFILRVLEQLALEPGQRVLEIGSGSGWLAGIMGRLVGPEGKVTGIEIIPSLAEQSRADLAAAGIDNVEILATDGGDGWPGGAPYDRVIFTAGTPDLPAAFYDQVREGGLLVAPFRHAGGGCDLAVLEKRRERFCSRRTGQAFFVPLTGAHGGPNQEPARVDGLPFWPAVRDRVVGQRKLWFGGPSATAFAWLTAPFRGLFAKLEPGVMLFGGEPTLARTGRDGFAFGLADPETRSLAVFEPYALTGYGTPSCFDRCLAAYRRWCQLGMPGSGAIGLVVHRTDRPGTVLGPNQLSERRGESTFTWLLPGMPMD